MSQVDLRPLFDPPSDPKPGSSSALETKDTATGPGRKPPAHGRPSLDGPEWANVAFVIAACAGAIFSAACLFRGGALLQEVAAWPRELFTGRPVSLVEAAARDSLNTEAATTVLAAPLTAAAPNESGDPFSSAKKLLRLDRSPMGRLRGHENPFTTRLLGSPPPPQSSIPVTPETNAASHNVAGAEAQVRQAVSAATAEGNSAAQAVAARSAYSAGSVSTKASRAIVRATARTMQIAKSVRSSSTGNAGRGAKTSVFRTAMRSIASSLGISKRQNRRAAPSRSISTLHRPAAQTTKLVASSQHSVPLNRAQRRIALIARHKQKALANSTRRPSKAGRISKAPSTTRGNAELHGSAMRIQNNAPAKPSFTRPATLPSPSQPAASFRGGNGFGAGRSIGNFGSGTMGAGIGHGGGRGR